jgi:large subunit ribosomal protein L10
MIVRPRPAEVPSCLCIPGPRAGDFLLQIDLKGGEIERMPTPKKEATVEELVVLLRNSQVAVLTDYRGMSVATITQLRRQLRDKGVEYHVTKNTLMTRAAHEAGVPQLEEMLIGPTAIAFVGDDIAGGIKALNDFVRTSRLSNLIRGALFGPSLVPADKVESLATIPTRQQLYGQIVGNINGPLTNLVGTLNGLLSQLVNTLQNYADKQGTDAPAEAVSASTAEMATSADMSAPTADVVASTDADAPAADTATAAGASAPTAEVGAAADASASTAEMDAPAAETPAPTPDTEASADTAAPADAPAPAEG